MEDATKEIIDAAFKKFINDLKGQLGMEEAQTTALVLIYLAPGAFDSARRSVKSICSQNELVLDFQVEKATFYLFFGFYSNKTLQSMKITYGIEGFERSMVYDSSKDKGWVGDKPYVISVLKRGNLIHHIPALVMEKINQL